jgi:hypothetical protein
VALPAAGLADVLVRDALPAVGRGVEHDRLHPPAGALLALTDAVAFAPDAGDRGLEPVAPLLELGQRLKPCAARAAEPRRGGGAGEGARDVACELLLEARDLLAQRGAGRPLVDVGADADGAVEVDQRGGHRQPPIGALGFVPQKIWVPSIPTT